MFRKFIKEKAGGVMEWVMILGFVGILLIFISPGLRHGIYNVYMNVTGQAETGTGAGQTYFNESGKPVIKTVNDNKDFTAQIRTYTSSNIYTSGTKFQFAGQASGGSGSFEYEWRNYSGNTSGKIGPVQTYTPGTHTIVLIIKDKNTGKSKQETVTFTINNEPQVTALALYDTGGNVVSSPYAKKTYRIGVVPASGTNQSDYTCYWDSGITLAGYNDVKNNCASSATFQVNTQVSIPINVSVCLVSDPSNCKNIAQTFEIAYPPVFITSITASPSKSWYTTTEGIIFSATGSGGSESLSIEWQNYNGDPDKNGINNSAQTYGTGSQIVQARACDTLPPAGRCSAWTSFAFNVGNPINFGLSANASSVRLNQAVVFTLTGESGGSGNYTYYWTITDHGSSTYTTNTAVSKTFTTTGTKTVTVRVCDSFNTINCTTKSISITVSNPQPSTFGYTGNVQRFTAPTSGLYKLETWGAQGGTSSVYGSAINNGGYASGFINLTAGQVLEIYVGGRGGNVTQNIDQYDGMNYNGGYNGGGSGVGSSGAGGGGATDIRTTSSTTSLNNIYDWNFASSLNGFYSGTTTISSSGGNLRGNITTYDGYFYSPNINFVGKTGDIIEITVKNNSANTAAEIYFSSTASGYSESQVVRFTMTPNDTGYKTYTINMNASANWTGRTITGIRFDLANGSNYGDFLVSSIKVKQPTTTAASRVIVAGGGGGNARPDFTTSYGGVTQSTGILYYGQSGDLPRHVSSWANDEAGGGGGYYGGSVVHGDDPRASWGGTSWIGNLTSSSMIAGNQSMPAPGGGSQVGQSGHGYARITPQ